MAYVWAAIGVIAIIVAVVRNPGLAALVAIAVAVGMFFPPAAPVAGFVLLLLWWFR